jgi:hypothetical protein
LQDFHDPDNAIPEVLLSNLPKTAATLMKVPNYSYETPRIYDVSAPNSVASDVNGADERNSSIKRQEYMHYGIEETLSGKSAGMYFKFLYKRVLLCGRSDLEALVAKYSWHGASRYWFR